MTSRFRTLAPVLTALLLLLIISGVLFSLKNPVSLDDGLRHLAMARLMRERGIFAVNGWSEFMYSGSLSTLHTDPWFLSDVLLIPLTHINPVRALQIFTIAQIAVLYATFLLVLRRVPLNAWTKALLILLLITGNADFLGRSLLGRPFVLMTALTLLVFDALFLSRWALLALLLTIASLLSHLFVFPLALSAGFVLWLFVLRRHRDALHCSIAIMLGTASGLALHPYPLEYLRYLLGGFLAIPFHGELGLATELQSGILFDSVALFVSIGVTVLLLQVAALTFRIPWNTWVRVHIPYLGGVVIVLFILYLRFIRTIDFLWPTLLLTIATVLSLSPKIATEALRKFLPRALPRWLPLTVIMIFALLQSASVLTSIVMRNDRKTLTRFRALEAIPRHADVLNVDWDLFPPFLSLRPDLRFATGMDPTFIYLTNPSLSRLLNFLWTEPFTVDHPVVNAEEWVRQIKMVTPGQYLVLEASRHKAFVALLERAKNIRMVSRTGSLAIFAFQR